MAKHTFETKMEAVNMVLTMGYSDYAVAEETGISRSCIRRWVDRYNQFGEDGLMLKHGSYSGEFKITVIEYMHENHLSFVKTAVLFGIPTDVTVAEWEKIYYKQGPEALMDDKRGRKSQYRPNPYRQKMEEEILKKVKMQQYTRKLQNVQ